MKGALSRRAAVVATAAGAMALGVGGVCGFADEPAAGGSDDAASAAYAVAKTGDPNAQYGFLMNVTRCTDCGECVKACRAYNGTPASLPSRRRIEEYTDSAGRVWHISMSCMHCEEPSCVRVCPAGAITKTIGGIVVVNKDRCIGCKYCYQACPFEAPKYDGAGMYKCDFCLGCGVALGDLPHCVQACKTQALRYGKLEDLLAHSSWATRIGGPTKPSAVLD